MSSYWSKVLSGRLARRKALTTFGGAAFSTAFLAACGGDDDAAAPGATTTPGGAPTSSGTAATGATASTGATAPTGATAAPSERPSLLGVREDTSDSAKPGGIFRRGVGGLGGAASSTLDPSRNLAPPTFDLSLPVYSSLLKWDLAVGERPAPNALTGDAAESWETSPDGLSLTLKLRPGHKFDPRPPTNGRQVTSADVQYSWQRTAELSALFRGFLAEHSEGAPLESVDTPDSETVVIKLAYPYPAITELLSLWYLFVMPVEAEDQFDARNEARGSGPFRLASFEPDVKASYERNPDWYEEGRPFLDGMDFLVIPENVSRLAQFEAGEIWTLDPNDMPQKEVLRLKHDHPQMVLMQGVGHLSGIPDQSPTLNFSQREDSPFRDVRLRQAFSYLYDVDLFLESIHHFKDFEDAGLPVENFKHSHLATQCENWIDPRDTAFGENGKYFRYDPEEAKRLIDASGFTGSIDFNYAGFSRALVFGVAAETFLALIQPHNLIELNLVELDATKWREMKLSGWDSYSGMFQNSVQNYNDDSLLSGKYTPGGKDTLARQPIPEVTDRVTRITSEWDVERRNQLIKELQSDLAPMMLDLPLDVINQKPFLVHWPWFKNYNVFGFVGFDPMVTTGRPYTRYWYDASQQ